MTHVVPTIRAGALHPAIRWLHQRGRPVATMLRAAGLRDDAPDEPAATVPVHCVATLLLNMARAEGPASLWQAGLATDPLELGGLGAQMFAAGTLERALGRIDGAMARHCTHERIAVEAMEDRLRLKDSWSIDFDPETLHCVQAYTAGIVGAFCAATVAAPPLFATIALAPHPERGLDHLRPWLEGVVVEAIDASLVIDIPWAVARAAFRTVRRDPESLQTWRPLRDGQSFATSVRRAIASMMGGEALTVGRVAAACGMSVRTFQRRLIDERTTFSDAVDAARRDEALSLIEETETSLAEIATRLGYANPSAFTRAVRRWTGASPSTLRRKGEGDAAR